MHKKFLFILLISCCLGQWACNENGAVTKDKVAPMTPTEYDYLAASYANNPKDKLEKNLTKSKLYEKAVSETYKNEPANYMFTSYAIQRMGEHSAIGVLIQLDIDRIVGTLGGAKQREKETKYFCIPSAKSNPALFEKYNDNVQALGFKDYEVFLAQLSKLLAETYL